MTIDTNRLQLVNTLLIHAMDAQDSDVSEEILDEALKVAEGETVIPGDKIMLIIHDDKVL